VLATAYLESPTLAVDRQVRARLAARERVLHLAFGEAELPVLPEAATALASGTHINSYGPVAGSAEARAAVAQVLRSTPQPYPPPRMR